MASFTDSEMDWGRIDFSTIAGEGVACVAEGDAPACRNWLEKQGYTIEQIDFTKGFHAVKARIGELFKWEECFGYKYEDGKGNLDALNDGFEFDIPETGGIVLELIRPDTLWSEADRWIVGLIGIATSHTRYQMAQGRRFFTILVIPKDSHLIGKQVSQKQIPTCWWSPAKGPLFK